jgi:hypothetical protein
MYVDNVATGRADVVRPWREQARLANSYFQWSFGLALALLATLLVSAVPLVWGGLELARHGFHVGIVAGMVLVVLILGVVILAASLFSVCLRDFVAPIQWAMAQPCGVALQTFWTLARGAPGVFALYLLLKLVFSVVLGASALLVACLTCCCGLLPVIHQTLFQPAYYFERSWSLCLLAGFGYDLVLPGSADTKKLDGMVV